MNSVARQRLDSCASEKLASLDLSGQGLDADAACELAAMLPKWYANNRQLWPAFFTDFLVVILIPCHFPLSLATCYPHSSISGAMTTITFGDEQAVTMKADMTEADLSSKQLGASGALVVAAFLPKCQ